jgi:hypothetical protein
MTDEQLAAAGYVLGSNGELVARETEPQGILDLDLRGAFVHNLPEDPLVRWQILGRVRGGETTPIADVVGQTFRVKHYVAHGVEIAGDDGEVRSAIRVALVTPDGGVLTATSGGIVDSLQLLRAALGDKIADIMPAVTVRSIRTRRGFKTLVFEPAVMPSEKKGGAK